MALSDDNTAADAFYNAAGEFGLRAFGVVLFAAGLSSVIGAASGAGTDDDRTAAARGILRAIKVCGI